MEVYPFDDRFVEVELTGREIKEAFHYLFTLKPDGSVMNGTFLYGKGFRLVADGANCWTQGCTVESITLHGKEFEDDRIYHVGMTHNCAANSMRYFALNLGDERQRTLSLSTYHDLARWCLSQEGPVKTPESGRFSLLNFKG